MEKNNAHRGPGFMNGLFLGIVIGAAIVFLIGTKKGKQILKLLTEKGIDGVNDLEEMLAENEAAEEFEEEYAAEGETMDPIIEEVHRESSKAPHKPLKRFFRGIKKMGSN